MEVPKNKLPENVEIFINSLKNYIDEPIYFFGSVNRIDYLQDKSDIDAAIFSNNTSNLIILLKDYLQIDKNDIKNIVLNINKTVINGYKIHYKHIQNKIDIEFVIYDIKFKKYMLEHYKKINNTPIYVCYILLLLKYLQMLYILPSNVYYKIKYFLFTYVVKLDNNIVVLN